ncbi:nicotinamide/nicotinic acid mononucleotide adenylyltransferase 3-like isoform X2 [Sitodiplosis mosellana]|uniref:nicotinamide/nicotinic acid mononucleotide adenylyltransferase 3-like isoform X2 n=1 Tax=Sitodiplosis mosellana TaxID=263140 RepID=UPI00244453B0|nr:nicotinamide/nicotinic acid mononucleotide adenylyltransferase 3-like isoform X2 [Sitodiplosis mosellana]
MVSSKKIIFLACGSFNPPTPMHLRMFEIARDHFRERAEYEVIGGIISPVHDSYGKPELALGKDRCAMVKISLQTSDWIRLSDWECNEQSDWTRTRISLQYHQNYINSVLNDSTTNGVSGTIPSWLPPNIYKYKGDRVQVKLLCGADLLESFATPKLWKDDDIEAMLGEHGIVVITRSETCPEKFIFQSDLLTKYKHRIDIITNWVPNEVSSTLARRYLRRGLSVKYMLDDNVVEYIRHKKLFGVDSAKYIITPGESETTAVQSLSPNYINDNYIKKTDQANYNYETMDETDHTPKKSSLKSTATSDDATATTATDDDRSRRLSANQPKCRLSRPGQAIQIRTDMNGTRTIDHEDEVDSKRRKKSSACDT